MKPELKVNHKEERLANAMGVDLEKWVDKLREIIAGNYQYSKVLSRIWEEAKTPEEAMYAAFMAGAFSERFIEPHRKEGQDEGHHDRAQGPESDFTER